MCVVVWFIDLFFFFKQKTAYDMRISDWSSDVCSSDLVRTNWAFGRIQLGRDDRALAAQPCPIGAVETIGFDREHRVDAMRLAQREIVLAMIRGQDRKSVV